MSSDGLIVTSAHAVRGATRLRVATADGKAYDATIAASDVADGIVVLRAAGASGSDRRCTSPAQDPRIGDLAVAVFRPALGTLTTRSGVVSAVGVNASDGAVAARRPALRRRHRRARRPTARPWSTAPVRSPVWSRIGLVRHPAWWRPPAATPRPWSAASSAARAAPTGSFGVTSVLIDASVAAAAAVPQGALVQSVRPHRPGRRPPAARRRGDRGRRHLGHRRRAASSPATSASSSGTGPPSR